MPRNLATVDPVVKKMSVRKKQPYKSPDRLRQYVLFFFFFLSNVFVLETPLRNGGEVTCPGERR